MFKKEYHMAENIDLERPTLRYILFKKNYLGMQKKKAHGLQGEKLDYLQTFQQQCFMPKENGVTYLEFSEKE